MCWAERARLALALALAASPAVASAQERCAIEGVASGLTVTVRAEGERGYRRVRLDRPTPISIAPLRSGVTSVRMREGDAVVEGTTGTELPIVLTRAISLREGTLELPAGLPVARARVANEGPWAVIDVELGDGLHLRSAHVPCDALAIASGDPSITALAPVDARGPRWRARTTRLLVVERIDVDRSLRVDVAPGASARFVELDRRAPWVRVAMRTSLGVRLQGWVHDWDLAR